MVVDQCLLMVHRGGWLLGEFDSGAGWSGRCWARQILKQVYRKLHVQPTGLVWCHVFRIFDAQLATQLPRYLLPKFEQPSAKVPGTPMSAGEGRSDKNIQAAAIAPHNTWRLGPEARITKNAEVGMQSVGLG